MGQYSMVDSTRQPQGKETAWAYTHVPQQPKGDAGDDDLTGSWDERETERFVARIEAEIERRAPGFGALIRERHVFTPPTLEAANSNLVGGAINSGTAQIHQQLVFRPTPGLARPETPIDRLYLSGASAHPGGGVHGAAGANAAAAVLAHGQADQLGRRRRGGLCPCPPAPAALSFRGSSAGTGRIEMLRRAFGSLARVSLPSPTQERDDG